MRLTFCFIVMLSTSIPESEGVLKCYKCLAAPPFYYSTEPFHLCKDFDYSEKFVVECPLSTFCMKRIVSAKISGLINGTERDCARQSQVVQIFNGGKYHRKDLVEDPYEPGCSKINDKGIRTSTTENCYCNTDLCNSAKMYRQSLFCAILTVISLIIPVVR